jgi:hypothetical protein
MGMGMSQKLKLNFKKIKKYRNFDSRLRENFPSLHRQIFTIAHGKLILVIFTR